MSLDKFFSWIARVVIAFAVMGKLDVLQAWIWRAQAKATYQSRTSTWGSPRFFSPTPKTPPSRRRKHQIMEPIDGRLLLFHVFNVNDYRILFSSSKDDRREHAQSDRRQYKNSASVKRVRKN